MTTTVKSWKITTNIMTNKQINKLMNCLLNNKNKKIIKYEPINKYRDRQTNEHMYGYLKCRLMGRQTEGRTYGITNVLWDRIAA